MLELRDPISQTLLSVTEFLVAILRLFQHSWRMAKLREEAQLRYYHRLLAMDAEVQSFIYATNELVKLERVASDVDLSLHKNREILMQVLHKTAERVKRLFDEA